MLVGIYLILEFGKNAPFLITFAIFITIMLLIRIFRTEKAIPA
jgi:hypothetical protein